MDWDQIRCLLSISVHGQKQGGCASRRKAQTPFFSLTRGSAASHKTSCIFNSLLLFPFTVKIQCAPTWSKSDKDTYRMTPLTCSVQKAKTKINEQIRPNKIKHTDTENRAEVTKGKWARDQTGKGDQLYGDGRKLKFRRWAHYSVYISWNMYA